METELSLKKNLYMPRTSVTTESNKTGSWRFLRPRYEEKTAPCSAACPVGEDIARIEMLITQGAFKEAWETILRENPLPGVCGRVCYHPCEGRCNRREFDTAIAVHTMERFLADTAVRNEMKPAMKRQSPQGKSVAIIGSGPAGLAAAWFLNMLGYESEIFEAMPAAGGLLRWGIPAYRLPTAVLNAEIGRIESLGVRIRVGEAVSASRFEEIQASYDAVFLGCGYWRSTALNIPGESGPGVADGLSFLRQIRQGEKPEVTGVSAIIGGGNTAIDVARSIVRRGGRAVIVYRRRRKDMPAFDEEIGSALEEGVELRELLAPVRITAQGADCILTVQPMQVAGVDRDGRGSIIAAGTSPVEISVQRIFVATGAAAAMAWHEPPPATAAEGHHPAALPLHLSHCTLQQGQHGTPIVYGGDLTTADKNVTQAIASGKQAAMALDTFFQGGAATIRERLAACLVGAGPALSMEMYMHGPRKERKPHIVSYQEINTDYFQFEPRVVQPRLLIEERTSSFDEIELKISATTAMREAGRCFNCGICNDCDNCYFFCPDVCILRGRDMTARHINYDYCKGCGLCVVECPRNAMTLGEGEKL
jgi:NADPH-dependent glutamate synthase beta subunit-like oxidoreductase/NAD-dependent dihydropyrimidine dehydrogenase PreA subunit